MKEDHVLEGPGAFEGGQSSIIEIRVTVSWIELFVRFDVQLVGKLGLGWIRVSDGECHHLRPEFSWLCGTEFGSIAGSARVAEHQINILTLNNYSYLKGRITQPSFEKRRENWSEKS